MGVRAEWCRGLVTALAFVYWLGLPGQADAYWKDNSEVTLNSAYVVEPGEFVIGVFTPLEYGVLEGLSVSVHPVLALLVAPNVTFRYNVLSRPVAVTLTFNYVQSFLNERSEADGGGYPGTMEGGLLVSVEAARQVSVTPYLGYLTDFVTLTSATRFDEVLLHEEGAGVDFATRQDVVDVDTEFVEHGLVYGAGVNWLINARNLLMFQVRAVVAMEALEHELPSGSVTWAYSWERTRVGVGLAVGRFPIRTGDSELVELPVYPILDYWLHF